MASPLPTGPSERASRALRVIIVDDSREYMAVLRRMLAASLPEIEVTEYDPDQQGKPGPGFDWSLYDVLLLDQQLGGSESGIEWLKEFKPGGRLPPTVLMTTTGDDYLAARAIKAGAWDYIRKQDVTSGRIGRMVVEAAESRSGDALGDETLREESASPHVAILDQLVARHPLPQTADGSSVGYRFVRLIGQGASSRVYLAERITDDTSLVLKVIDIRTSLDIQIVERFIREAEIVSALTSPYVVRFYDYGLTQAYGYIAMEFFTRGDLKQRIERGVGVDDALNYVRHITLGLEAIHAHGIIHRDLKPGNIMFRADDSLALADFGIARRLDSTSDLTNQGSVLGTPNYLSPEQALGEPVDHRADLYSVGVVLFEMLAGRKPFRAESAAALIYQHVHADIPKLPRQLRHLQPLIDGLLAKQAASRVESARALLDLFDGITHGQ